MDKMVAMVIRTCLLVVLISSSGLTKAQHKNCNAVYAPGPIYPCTLTPMEMNYDTAIVSIPKGCNSTRFDSTANGPWKIYSRDTLLEIVNLKSGTKHGQNIHFYKNGRIQGILNYENGKLSGKTILYNELGQITGEGIYDKGELFGGVEMDYWDNGKMAYKQDMTEGWMSGTTEYWDSNGKQIDKKKFEELWHPCN